MKRRVMFLLLALTVLAFSGCALRTVDEMYSLPKRSEEYNKLQSAIDIAMVGLDYSAPVSGDNRQTLQTADLDGDGVDEYIVFAKGDSEKPLQLLVFRSVDGVRCELWEVLSFRGSAFDLVEYVNIDTEPGCEIILGRQISDQVLGSLSVFSFGKGEAVQLLSADYTQIFTCELDGDPLQELLLMRSGEADMQTGVAVLYDYRNGSMERSVEAQMSARASDIKRITLSQLYGGTPAVYVASAGRDNTVVTDVFVMTEGRFVNIAATSSSGTSVDTLRNYAVYADDLDGDGVLELPKLLTTKSIFNNPEAEKQYLLRWYSMDIQGNEVDKLCTFHNFASGWYLLLDSSWASYLTMEQRGNNYTFYMWSEDFNKVTILFTISEFSGNDREYQASQNNRFVLYRDGNVTYAAKLETGSAMYGFTEDFLINSFRMVQAD